MRVSSVRIVVLGLCVVAAAAVPAVAALDPAQQAFYSARYEEAASLASDACTADDFAACELRSSALHFELKRALGESRDKDKALKECAKCGALLDAFTRDTERGQKAARARLQQDPMNEEPRYFRGKLDLNYVWLQAGTLGRKTGLNEYREARRSLDTLLKRNPQHVRGQVARAWMDYIVDTRMPWGTKWIFGGGNRKRALTVMREAAKTQADDYSSAEARFGLWDMLARERNYEEAVVIARELAVDFPTNADLPKFIQRHGTH